MDKPQRDCKVGDIVIVQEDDLPRNQGLLGRVIEVIPSEDGRI